MLRIGLTGGIGSGKSTVCSIFRELGAAVIDTDELAREAVSPGSPALAAVLQHFGHQLLCADGTLDRPALRRMVFDDPQQREALEAIVHPTIRRLLTFSLEQITSPYVIIAIPLLLEKQWQDAVDRILVVDCSEEQQRQRTLERDGNEPALVDKIMQCQVSRTTRLAAADDIIHNDDDLPSLRRQVVMLHSYYTQLAEQS